MSARSVSRVRTKVVALLTSLVALWAFAAFVTVNEGMNVVWFATLEQQVGKPTEAAVAAIQVERRATVAAVAAGPGAPTTDLATARRATDASIASMVRIEGATFAQWSMQGETHARIADFRAALATLTPTRAHIDAGVYDPTTVDSYYTSLIDQAEKVYDTFTVWDDATVIYQTSTLVMMTQHQEAISEEDALIAGVIADGHLTDSDRSNLDHLVGVQRDLATTIEGRLPSPDNDEFGTVLAGPRLRALRNAEDLIDAAPIGRPLQLSAAQWQTTVANAIDPLRQLILTLADRTVARTRPAVIWVIVRLLLAAGLGLVAVIASIRFSIRTVRTLQAQLADLRTGALDLAHVRLPRVVEQLRRGEDVDIGLAAPPLAHGPDDVGQVGAAFNVVQETAIRATVDQAELRRGVRDVFLNLARRSQAIVHRQLKLIDTMERRATTEAELAELFRIDHLATRMRRNAENLIVLSGSSPGRAWRGPVPLVDVARGGLAEIEEYTRVAIRSIEPAALAGRAVGDVIHLLAELMENAVSFSPPNTTVYITGQHVATGYAIEIEDRGLGMTPSDLAAANDRIAEPPEFQLSATSRLGFYVVGRLAQRHGVRVRLRTSPYDGTTAIVLLPASLIEPDVDVAGTPRGAGPRHAVPDEPTVVPVAEPVADPADTIAAMVDDVLLPLTADTARYTPSGLPLRARKSKTPAARPEPVDATGRELVVANLIPRLVGVAPTGIGRAAPNGRDPAEIRRIMTAYQQGANRGRSQAERGTTPGQRANESTGPAEAPDGAGAPDGKDGSA
jgi:signal transduction histidine kinase